MRWPQFTTPLNVTALTVLIGSVGAAIGWLIHAPIYVLLGPAVMVSLAGLAGLPTGIAPQLRNVCFVLLGLTVGAGFDRDALGTMIRWPLAFLAILVLTWAIMAASRAMLTRFFDFDRRSALLASAPGHLSFVIALAADTQADVGRVSVTQSVRLLSLTLVVPFIAIAMGVELSGSIAPAGQAMPLISVAGLIVVAVLLGLAFQRLRVPAALLMAAMVVSGLGHLTEATPGVLPAWLVTPAYLVLGALIGTRFSGITPARLASGLWAGVAITVLAVVFSAAMALPIGVALGMPVAHVLIAFAPGGLETMIAMGAVLGVVPGFVAACHITRLMVLSVLVPVMLGRR